MPASPGSASSAWPAASWRCIRAGGCERDCVCNSWFRDSHDANGHSRATPFPPPLWGRDRERGSRKRRVCRHPSPSRSRVYPISTSQYESAPRQAGVRVGEGAGCARVTVGALYHLRAITVILAFAHLSRLARAGFVFAREGVLALIDPRPLPMPARDRKSTRLNSSHLVISYAVFCLKKKKKTYNSDLFIKKKKKNKIIY